MGDFENPISVGWSRNVKYHPCNVLILTRIFIWGQCLVGSLTGAVASKKVTEAFKGQLTPDGNRSDSAKAQVGLIARLTSRARWKHGFSDPLSSRGWDKAQRTKVTLGITGWLCPRVHIDDTVWHLDVGSSFPGGGATPKGLAVRQLKRYASWVQNVVRQFGPDLLWAFEIWGRSPLVREDRGERASGVPVVLPRALLGSYRSEEINAESI